MKFNKNITNDHLFIWIIHEVATEFKDRALLKGGMLLTLADAPRKTIDLDYVFVPYSSKNEIKKSLMQIVNQIEDADISQSISSKNFKIIIKVYNAIAQIEATVDLECKSDVMTTQALAKKTNQLARIIRIMSFDVALSHKLAAWNERRLYRDLYDIYYIYKKIGIKPDLDVLQLRLQNINSNLKENKNLKKMTLREFKILLKKAHLELNQEDLNKELSLTLDQIELAGLAVRIKIALNELIDFL